MRYQHAGSCLGSCNLLGVHHASSSSGLLKCSNLLSHALTPLSLNSSLHCCRLLLGLHMCRYSI